MIVVAEEGDVVGRGLCAFLQAGVGQGVHHDVVVGTDETLDDAEACGPAGRIEDDLVHAEELGDLLFERDRGGGVADERRGAGAMDAVGLDRLARRIGDRRIGVHREIVLRGEVDALHGIAVVVARGDAAVRTVIGRAAERPEAVLAAEILPGVEAFDAREEVAAAGIAEVAHAAFERVGRGRFVVVEHLHS